MKLKAAIIGFGRMGRFYLKELQANPLYEVAYICDIDPDSMDAARQMEPAAVVTSNADDIFLDPTVQVVVLSACASGRHERIRQCFAHGKHVIAEKPIADTIEHEEEVLRMAVEAKEFYTVNLYLRNAWYHRTMREFIDSGEIGELAILRICHMTPGLAPGEGHEAEGPCFHDCGMHYVDLARWYAQSEFDTFHAQGLRMWDYKDPWWVQCHGTFKSGVVFDITQGFVYGHMSKKQTHNSYVDIIGTQGICRMTHNFKTATVELHGVNRTERIEQRYGGKNIDVLIQEMAESILSGKRHPDMPRFGDSAIASAHAWEMLHSACDNPLPVIGNNDELIAIRERRANMAEGEGYGLLPRNKKKQQ